MKIVEEACRNFRRNFRINFRRNFRRNFRGNFRETRRNFRGNFHELVGILGYCRNYNALTMLPKAAISEHGSFRDTCDTRNSNLSTLSLRGNFKVQTLIFGAKISKFFLGGLPPLQGAIAPLPHCWLRACYNRDKNNFKD